MNLIDTHVDTITSIMDASEFLLDNNLHISLNKLKQFDKKGIYFAIWLSKQKLNNPLSETIKAIDFYYNEVEKNKSIISHSNTFSEFNNTFNSGKVASLLSLEGGECLEGDLDNLYLLHDKGVRSLTLTWNNDNELGSGVLGSDKGLTDFGKAIIKKCNNLNMMIDISHLNLKGFFDVIELTEKPIFASHSNAYNIHQSKRNLFDEQLKEIKNTNSYVSFNIHTPFVNGTKNCEITELLPHIDYLINFLGEDYVSIGTDFDGTNLLPRQINNISDLQTLYNLVETTYNTLIANKIFYQNQLQFLQRVI